MLAPYAWYWFELSAPAVLDPAVEARLPVISVAPGQPWNAVLHPPYRTAVLAVLGRALQKQRWYGAKGRGLNRSRSRASSKSR